MVNNNDSLISIIIPTFNRGHCIANALESVINQSVKKWELIIIDDGSTDDTKNLVENYLDDNRIIYNFQKHQGVSTARNYGVSIAKGEFVVFLDSDDTFTSNFIEELYKHQFFKFDIIFWEVLRVSENDSKIGKPIQLGKFYNYIIGNFLAGCVCYKKEVFEKAGGYDANISFGENYELGIRISWSDKYEVKIINLPFLKYNIKTEGRSSSTFENRIKSYTYQMHKHKLLYSKNNHATSKMHYLIGYILEKNKSYNEALVSYKKSWLAFPFNIKSLLKIFYFKIPFRRFNN